MPILNLPAHAMVVALAGLLQASSPYAFAGVRLPMKAAEIGSRLHAKAVCRSHPYDVIWNINDPTGKVTAVVFTSARATNLNSPNLIDVTITDNTDLAETNRRAAR